MSDVLKQSEEEQVLERIARNKMQIEALQAENAILTDYFRERSETYPAGPRKEIGKFYIKVSDNTRLDDGLAQRELSPEDYARVSKVTLDTTKARKVLSPVEIDKITKRYENKIEVGIR